jgi:protein-tyrosine phosphatase
MAEFVMKDMVEKKGLSDQFHIASAATSMEEIGNPVYPGTRDLLNKLGISCQGKRAIHLERKDYAKYDYLIGMEKRNVSNILRIIGADPDQKVSCLLDFTNHPRDIDDPWYSRNFEKTYQDVKTGCEALLQQIETAAI